MKKNNNEELLTFLDQCPTCFHVVDYFRSQLKQLGYQELVEGSSWDLKKGKNYFVIRNESSIIAFRLSKEVPTGFMIAASHSDSPSFKIKENPEEVKEGYIKLNVEKYGGMLCAPWFDRPLSIAGRVVVKKNNTLQTKKLMIDEDFVLIPNLAIHMNREANDGYAYNVQKDMEPIFAQVTSKTSFLDVIAKAIGEKKEAIVGHDLYLYNRQKGTQWGANKEFISSGRLDDLQCGFANYKGFVNAKLGTSIPVLAIFDNEEVGSLTKQGADSTFLEDVLHRISMLYSSKQDFFYTLVGNSFMVSADNGHGAHPNYPEKADPTNRPTLNGGIVIKYHGNQKYTSDGISAGFFKTVCQQANVPYQIFTNRSDMQSGSTLGNLSNAHVSLNAVDIGLAQWAMHSPYETAGALDTNYLIQAMTKYFSMSFLDLGNGNWKLK